MVFLVCVVGLGVCCGCYLLLLRVIGVAVLCLCSWCLISLVVKITVGVGVDWPLAWLMTYGGADCQLWDFVHSKCMEAELCSELAKILTDELEKHRCFDNAPN
jgi:hypothetical protein